MCGLLTGCRQQTAADALSRGADYLVRAQAEDGAWRSSVYSHPGGAPALTAIVAKSLFFLGRAGPARKGADFLAGMVKDGRLEEGPDGLAYPVYTASGAVILLTLMGGRLAERDVWLSHLQHRQMTEPLGWKPEDAPYGGWGYSFQPPRKPGPGAEPVHANLSATLFAVGALRVAGRPAEDPALRRALSFIERCQAWPGPGGFFASPTDLTLNKAGPGEPGAVPRPYGSATADGLRALLRCGVAPDSERLAAARRWLGQRLDTQVQPGEFPPPRRVDRDSLYYYYCWSTAHALAALERQGAELTGPEREWIVAVQKALLDRQQEDGSWRNPASASQEDDPLVATPMALATLTLCRGLDGGSGARR